MDDNARIQLNRMIQENNVEDKTEKIRELKHSQLLKKDAIVLLNLRETYKTDAETLHNEAMYQCNFMFTYYTDIYNRIRKGEIDVNLLFRFLDILKKIEDGEVDQHEGSFMVGTILKEIYIDSALKKAEHLDEKYGSEEAKAPVVEPVKISWKEFKKL